MADEQKLSDLLIEWDQRRRSGDEPSVDDLCRDCPELSNELASRIEVLRNTDWMFGDDTDFDDDDDALSMPEADLSVSRIDLSESSLKVDEFVSSLAQSGLISDDLVTAVRDELPDDHSVDRLARELIRRKHLTAFQASTLLAQESLPLVLGDYEIQSRIGAGGMGEVFRARHRRMKRVVALKILPHKLTDDEAALNRFNREVEIVASLEHPNIVTAFDAGEQDGTHFLIMQFVDGCDLTTLVRSAGTLSVEKAIDFTLQAARGLAYAHNEGVIHRDIKPSNMLVNRKDRVKILDLGLARVDLPAAEQVEQRHELTTTGAVMGTVDYMAPEQAVNTRDADQRSDIYSLGCTLHSLLTGQPPYSGETMMQRLLAHREEPIPSLTSLRSEVPAELDEIFQRMLAKKPDDRFALMSEVVAALEKLASAGRVERVNDDSNAPRSTRPAIDHTPVAPEDTKTVLVDDVDIAIAQQIDDARDDTFSQSTVNTDPSLAPTIIKEAKPASSGIGRLKWIALAVLLVCGGTYLYGVTIGFKVEGGTIWLTGDPAVLEGAKVFVDDRHVLTIESADDPKSIKVSVDKQKGKLRVEKAGTGFLAFGREFDLSLSADREPITVRFEADQSAGRVQRGNDDPNAPRSTRPTSSIQVAGTWKPGPSEDVLPGLVPTPAVIPGVKRWNVETAAPRGRLRGLEWSPNGKWLACAEDGGPIRVYEYRDGQPRLFRLFAGDSGGHRFRWSPDSKWIADVSENTHLRIWDVEAGRLKIDIESPASLAGLAFSPDSASVAAAPNYHDTKIRVWNLEGQLLEEIDVGQDGIHSLDWHPDGKLLAMGGFYVLGVQIWDLQAKAPVFREKDCAIVTLAWDSQGTHLAARSRFDNQARIRIWDPSGKLIGEIPCTGHVQDFTWSPDGSQLCFQHDRLHFWKIGREPERVFSIPNYVGGGLVSWSPGGKHIARCVHIGTHLPLIELFDIDTQKLESTIGLSLFRTAVNWSPDGNRIVSGGYDHRARLWSANGEPAGLISAPGAPIRDVAWSPDGHSIAVGGGYYDVFDSSIHVWDADEHRLAQTLRSEKDSQVLSLSWSPDSKRLVSGHGDVARVWEIETGQIVQAFQHATDNVQYTRWSPHNDLIASRANDGLRIWNSRNGEQVREMPPSVPAWHPTDNKLLVQAPGSQQLAWWDFTDEAVSEPSITVPGHGAHEVASPGTIAFTFGGNRSVASIVDLTSGEKLGEIPGHLGSNADWRPTSDHLVCGGNAGEVSVWDAAGNLQWIGIPLTDDQAATFTPAGELLYGDPATVEQEIVYIVEHDDGHIELLRHSEFQKLINQPLRYEPTQPQLIDSPDRRAAEWVLSVGGRVDIDVNGGNQQVDNADALPQADFQVTNIDLVRRKGVADEDLKRLQNLVMLQRLDVGHLPLTDDGIRHLLNLPRLINLNLTGTSVTAFGVKELQNLSLHSLSVGYLPVTPESIAVHRDLRGLDLSGVKGADNVLAETGKFAGLLTLTARDGADITGTGLQHLQNATQLYMVDCTATNLTDDDIKPLHKITSLTTVRLVKTNVTEAGVNGLSKALPDCRIEWDGGVVDPKNQ